MADGMATIGRRASALCCRVIIVIQRTPETVRQSREIFQLASQHSGPILNVGLDRCCLLNSTSTGKAPTYRLIHHGCEADVRANGPSSTSFPYCRVHWRGWVTLTCQMWSSRCHEGLESPTTEIVAGPASPDRPTLSSPITVFTLRVAWLAGVWMFTTATTRPGLPLDRHF